MKLKRIGLGALILLQTFTVVHGKTRHSPVVAPQPTACIESEFTSTGGPYWKNINLKLTNNCGKSVDFQNAAVNFMNGELLNTNFWGQFSPLPYPDNYLQITSQQQSDGKYLSAFNLHFPTYTGSSTLLPQGKSITINYGASKESHIGKANVYLNTSPSTGTLSLTNVTAKPTNVSTNYVVVHISSNGKLISDVSLPWQGNTDVNVAPGAYTLAAENIKDSGGNTYQGQATPASLTVAANQIAKSTISYSLLSQSGKIAVQLQALPVQLTGYNEKPVVTLSDTVSGSSVSQPVNWNSKTTIEQLISGHAYTFTTPVIIYNNYQCKPSFSPESLTASETAPTTQLTYTCSQIGMNNVSVNVSGAPTTLSNLNVSFTPNDGAAISQAIPLSNGSGSGIAKLVNSVAYTVSSDAVAGYTIKYTPQPLISTPTAKEDIVLTSQSGSTPIEINGQLKVCGTQLCNKDGTPIQLRGMSSHGLQWYGWNVCLKPGSLDTLANNFKATVVRLSMYVQEDGYETDPVGFTNQMNLLINEATKRGIYVIVDWHMLTPGDPNYNLTRAKKFFTDVATANKGKINLLYEICNEPNGVNWTTIKNYAEQIIPVIRSIDPNAVILVGTRAWSSLGVSDGATSQEIINNPVNASNIMYTFHFYAASHRDEYLNELDKASNRLPMFVTEWGSQNYSGEGANDFAMSDKYMALMAKKKIGWTNWNYSDDFRSGAAWKEGTCSKNTWTDANLKEAGVYVKSKIIG